MQDKLRSKLIWVTTIYWALLLYIIAALLWWYISLWHQNKIIYNLEVKQAGTEKIYEADTHFKTNQKKYIGEGLAFLLVILVGAVFVHRSVRRQLLLQRQQQNFMMAVTHELKTPISIISLSLETLTRHELSPEKKSHLLHTALQENSRLHFLTNNILVASQLEGNRYSYSHEQIELSTLVTQCVKDFRSRFMDRLFEKDIEQGLYVKGDMLLSQMLVNNLLENAVKYSPKDKPIRILLYKLNKHLHLEVKDHGAGIPVEEREAIFTRFYRIGNESTRKAKGTGLGLYLCKKITADMGGDINVTDNKPNGSIFTVRFPII